MTQQIDRLQDVASNYDVVVFDQWGVLHDGTAPYPDAVQALETFQGTAAVLSNSGKRAAPNAQRINGMGFSEKAFTHVMTSGEALYMDLKQGRITARSFYAIERESGDAARWADGLNVDLVTDVDRADAILMMGLPDGATLSDWEPALQTWHQRKLPMYCSNPDRQSPRAGGLVTSPGAVAHAYETMGGKTSFYGKPHPPVFEALEHIFGKGRYLMVGDSMEHDIAGAQGVGWDSLLIEGGLYVDQFAKGDGDQTVARLAASNACDLPTYRMKGLR